MPPSTLLLGIKLLLFSNTAGDTFHFLSFFSSTSILKNHYFFSSLLPQAIDKAKSQSHLPGSVFEMLSAATLVTKLATLDEAQRGESRDFESQKLPETKKKQSSIRLCVLMKIMMVKNLYF